MTIAFYITGLVAIYATVMVITRPHALHALLYLIVSLLAVAVIFFLLGAPFAAALEVIIYAGAIIVLFVFVVMMLNLGRIAVEQERRLLRPGTWAGPSLLSVVLLIELTLLLARGDAASLSGEMVSAGAVGRLLFGPYLLAVELASMLLLAGLVGAYSLGRRTDDRVRAGADGDADGNTTRRRPDDGTH